MNALSSFPLLDLTPPLDPTTLDMKFAPTSMPLQLLLISHAVTNAVRVASFPTDEPIQAVDFTEAITAVENIGPIDKFWTGPERRTRETAANLHLPLPAVVEPILADCDYGKWKGRRFADIDAEEPDALANWVSDPDAAPHGGESLLDLFTRVIPWLDELVNAEGRFVAVSHPPVIRAAILHALGAPHRTFWRINVEPLCFADLRANNGQWTLRSLTQPPLSRPDPDPDPDALPVAE